MNDKKIEKIVNFDVPQFDPVVICPSNNKLPMFFDPSLNGHDFFSKTISCSCVNTNNKKHECTAPDEDGCRRTRKNEYARQQMKKYREKLKQDPVRYMKYLQSERIRNARRKLRKVQKIISEGQHSLSNEQLTKLEKRYQNLLNKSLNRLGKEYLAEIKINRPQSDDSFPSIDTIEEILNKIQKKTYPSNKSKYGKYAQVNLQQNENSSTIIEEIINNNVDKLEESQESDMPTLHFCSSIFNGKQIDKTNATVYEIGRGGPFTNLKIVNDATNSKEYIVPDTDLKSEDMIDIKEEPISDPENENSLSADYNDFNMNDDDSFSDEDSLDDNDFKTNRICAIVNCPSRYINLSDIKYYPFPPQKDIRDCWFNLIKNKTNQWIIDPDAFVCSLHFSPTWFQKSPSYGNKMLLLNAVPTIFPNDTESQFDINIPLINNVDYIKPDKFKNYYEWSCMKLREQENLLKKQQFIIENHTEYKIVQTKRIEKLYKAVDDFKTTLNFSSNSNNNDILKSFLQQIDYFKTDLISPIV